MKRIGGNLALKLAAVVTVICCCVALAGARSQSAHAHGAKLLTKQIPAKRLIQNLKAKVLKDPNDPEAQFQLARAYMISAYMEKTYLLYRDGTVAAYRFRGPPYDHGDRWGVYDTLDEAGIGVRVFPLNARWRVRWKRVCGKSPCDVALRYDKEALRKSALHQIEQAIEHYERALELRPDLLIKLGLGWALDVSGDDIRAKQLYREIVAQAWPSDREEKWSIMGEGTPYNYGDVYDGQFADFNGHLAYFVSYEAAFYLSALLDPVKDRKELADLRGKMIHLAKNGTGNAGITPIIIPMDRRSPLHALVDRAHYVEFNLDGLGKRRWRWTTAQAGFLVFVGESDDPVVASGHQLLGNVTFRNFWRNGYDAAASLDDNADGWLRDSELNGLSVWNDRDQDGKSDASELVSLGELHITGIAVAPRQRDGDVLFHSDGIEYSDGRTGPSYDWVSYPDPTVTN